MADISKYLLSVIAAAIISSLAIHFTSKKGVPAAVIRLLSGLFLLLTVVSPITMLHINDLTAYFADMELDSAEIIESGRQLATRSKSAIIKDQVEAYIGDKASSLGVDLQIDAVISQSEPPQLVSVEIQGAVSPYTKRTLQAAIRDELGVPEEKQIWK